MALATFGAPSSVPPRRRTLPSTPWPTQFIFTMRNLSRFHPPDRQVLENINLSFYPGAKIGVLGSNGAGKSSLLRIMAGEDDGYSGEARLTQGFTVGMLHQEPQLDPAKDVLGNVMDGVGETASLLERYDEVLAGWSDPDADYDKLGDPTGAARERDRGGGRLGPQAHDRHRDGRAPAPGRRRRRRQALRW